MKNLLALAIAALAMGFLAFGCCKTHPESRFVSTVFTFDGKDFVRTDTNLLKDDGKLAAGTVLDHDSSAFKALMRKESFSGEIMLFGKVYDAHYAPLLENGELKGALFIGFHR